MKNRYFLLSIQLSHTIRDLNCMYPYIYGLDDRPREIRELSNSIREISFFLFHFHVSRAVITLCSSLEHVLAFKMCSMKNICVQVLHIESVQYYRTRSRCSIYVALLVFKLCSIPEHMFLNTCKRSVPSDRLVFFLVKPFSTWCSNSVLSPLTLRCSILQNMFKAFNIYCNFGVQMVY